MLSIWCISLSTLCNNSLNTFPSHQTMHLLRVFFILIYHFANTPAMMAVMISINPSTADVEPLITDTSSPPPSSCPPPSSFSTWYQTHIRSFSATRQLALHTHQCSSFEWAGFPDSNQKYIPMIRMQLNPSPLKPSKQEHWKLPAVLIQAPLGSQKS